MHLGYGTVRFRLVSTLVDFTSKSFYKCTATFRKQICRKYLRIKLNRFRLVQTLVDISSNTVYKCTATFRTQICRKCLRIKLNRFRPVQTLVDITSNTFYKCTATFRTHCKTKNDYFLTSISYRQYHEYSRNRKIVIYINLLNHCFSFSLKKHLPLSCDLRLFYRSRL
jgi:predicted nucleic acid-binding Zn ribbon protein